MMCDLGGDNDFFLSNCNDDGGLEKSTVDGCKDTFSDIGYVTQMTDFDAVPIRYGLEYGATSNIVFT